MEIDAIGADIWDRLEKGNRLTSEQESLVKAHIQVGNFNDVSAIVKQLRENSRHLQQKTYQEVSKMIDNFKVLYVTKADQHLESAAVAMYEGVATNAQANRIQNRADQTQARMMTVADVQGIQYVYPERVADAGITSRAARSAANHQAATQAANAASAPQRQHPVGQASVDGARTAVAVGAGGARTISVGDFVRRQ